MRAKLILSSVLLTLAAVAVLNVVPAAADTPPPPIASEALTDRSVFPDLIDMKIKLKKLDGRTTVVHVDDPSRTATLKFTVQAGARFPWHRHYGPVVVNIKSGSLTYIDSDGCDETTYGQGQAFVDAGHGHVHSAYNPGTEPVVFIATFFEAPASGSLLIAAADPGC